MSGSRALERVKSAFLRETTLELMLAEMLEYGRPRLHCHDDLRWSAAVDLNTDRVEVEATLRSGFGHPTPHAAAAAALEKCRKLGRRR